MSWVFHCFRAAQRLCDLRTGIGDLFHGDTSLRIAIQIQMFVIRRVEVETAGPVV